jgi:hypothetical protein
MKIFIMIKRFTHGTNSHVFWKLNGRKIIESQHRKGEKGKGTTGKEGGKRRTNHRVPQERRVLRGQEWPHEETDRRNVL